MFWKAIKNMKEKTEHIYIYGAGLYARNMYKMLKARNISISGFIVTSQNKEKKLYEYPVLEARKVLHDNIGIIIAVNSHNKVEVIQYLNDNKFNMDKVIIGTDFLEKDSVRFDEKPSMEITTRIGCSINCKYCPQDMLLKGYYKENPNRESIMSVETFKICVDKMPKDSRIVFSGMAEPLLNPHCVEMMRIAAKSGRKLVLYTTLVGADDALLREIADIPFEHVTLHVADKFGYAHIPVDEKYYELLRNIINLKKKDGSPFVSMCNAQAEPDQRILEICQGKYEITTELLDRGGILKIVY